MINIYIKIRLFPPTSNDPRKERRAYIQKILLNEKKRKKVNPLEAKIKAKEALKLFIFFCTVKRTRGHCPRYFSRESPRHNKYIYISKYRDLRGV